MYQNGMKYRRAPEAQSRTRSRIPLDLPYRVIVEGNSVDTEILVGPLEVWTGIRKDVDWSRLMPGEVLDVRHTRTPGSQERS